MARLLQYLRRLSLLLTQLRNDTSIHESIKRLHVVRIPFRIQSRIRPGLEVEDGCFDVWFFADGDLAFAVEVPDWFCQSFCDVWAFTLEGVPDVVRGDDVRFAAFESAGDAEEADDVGVVGVEELSVFKLLLVIL
jgi:hypothetical protein